VREPTAGRAANVAMVPQARGATLRLPGTPQGAPQGRRAQRNTGIYQVAPP